MTFTLIRSFGDLVSLICVSEMGMHLGGFALAAISAACAWRLLKGSVNA